MDVVVNELFVEGWTLPVELNSYAAKMMAKIN